jgi:hypothetical protein
MSWHRNGSYYRDNDKPVIVYPDGHQEWRSPDGDLHRENDMPAIVRRDGVRIWFYRGKYIRAEDAQGQYFETKKYRLI